MKQIKLTRGAFALVDDEDFDRLNAFKWHAQGHPESMYACNRRTIKRPCIYMHRMLFPDWQYIDHINGNGLDNRRCNLREATKSQYGANRGPNRNNTTGYKGVCWNVGRKKWIAQLRAQGVDRMTGQFDSAEEAARAYDRAAVKAFGEFAYLNFPKEKDS